VTSILFIAAVCSTLDIEYYINKNIAVIRGGVSEDSPENTTSGFTNFLRWSPRGLHPQKGIPQESPEDFTSGSMKSSGLWLCGT